MFCQDQPHFSRYIEDVKVFGDREEPLALRIALQFFSSTRTYQLRCIEIDLDLGYLVTLFSYCTLSKGFFPTLVFWVYLDHTIDFGVFLGRIVHGACCKDNIGPDKSTAMRRLAT